MGAIISVRDLCKQYTTYRRGESFKETVKSLFVREKVIVDAVKNINFDIEEGTILGFLGKNGAGKSTTIKMMTGVLFPTSGEINVMGFVPFTQRAKYVARIGAVFGQKSQLIWDIPPIDSFYMNKAIYTIADQVFKANLDKMTALFDVSHVIHKPTRVLSLGERMKCEFIMAMLHNPKVVFLDEPTIGLDILSKEKIRDFILEMNKNGTTFVLTTHDIGDIEKLAERIIIIDDGEKVYDNKLIALKKHLGSKKTAVISMKTPIDDIKIDGVAVISRKTPCEIELSVDQAVINMNSFIAYIGGLGDVADISIKDMSTEEIVKSIMRDH